MRGPLFQDLQKILSLLEYDPRRATFDMIDVDIKSMKDKIDNTIKVGVYLNATPN